MILTRDKGQRMWGGNGGTSIGIGGSGGGSGGGVSIPYYNQNFELLYKKVVTDGTTGTVTTQYLTAAPNEIVNVGSETDPSTGDVTVTTIVGPKVKTALVIGDAMLVWDAQNSAVYVINRDGTTAANLYATGGVSALGYSAGGGGGGGVTALTDLLDVQISSPSNGQALVYDTSLTPAKWVNKTIFESMTYGSNVLSLTISGVTRNVTIQAGTSSVDWANITNKPNTATRWPTFAEVTSKPTTLGGYGITDAYISNGTIFLGGNSITPVTSLYGYATQDWVTNTALSGYATQQWVSQQGYLTSSAISDMATKTWVQQQGYLTSSAISDMATQTWVNQQGFLKVGTDSVLEIGQYLDFHVSSSSSDYSTRIYASSNAGNTVTLPLGTGTLALTSDNVASATKLQTARNLWGNSFDGTADIGTQNSNASLNYVANINMSGNLTMAGSLYVGSNIHESGNFLLMNYASYGLMVEGYANQGTLHRSSFGLHNANGIIWSQLSGTDDIIMQLITDTNRTFAKKYAQFYDGIRIGDGMIVWDSANNAFQVIKSDGTAANLYTTGGVSALGMSAGVSSIDAMTFGYLTVNSRLTLPSTIVAGTSPTITQYANDSDCIYLFYDSATSKINSKTYRFTQYDNVGIHGTDYNYGETWWIDPDGCAMFQRIYLASNVYLFTNGSDIRVRIGSNVYTLTKT